MVVKNPRLSMAEVGAHTVALYLTAVRQGEKNWLAKPRWIVRRPGIAVGEVWYCFIITNDWIRQKLVNQK